MFLCKEAKQLQLKELNIIACFAQLTFIKGYMQILKMALSRHLNGLSTSLRDELIFVPWSKLLF